MTPLRYIRCAQFRYLVRLVAARLPIAQAQAFQLFANLRLDIHHERLEIKSKDMEVKSKQAETGRAA